MIYCYFNIVYVVFSLIQTMLVLTAVCCWLLYPYIIVAYNSMTCTRCNYSMKCINIYSVFLLIIIRWKKDAVVIRTVIIRWLFQYFKETIGDIDSVPLYIFVYTYITHKSWISHTGYSYGHAVFVCKWHKHRAKTFLNE